MHPAKTLPISNNLKHYVLRKQAGHLHTQIEKPTNTNNTLSNTTQDLKLTGHILFLLTVQQHIGV